MFMRLIKRIGIVILVLSMMYASNWDLPKETPEDWEREHWEELRVYEQNFYENEIPHGRYIDGVWYESLELYGGVIPEEYMETEDVEI